MNVLNENTKQVFEKLSQLELIRDYTFIGGTALALQLKHRISEDLDFCRWAEKPRKVLIEVNEKEILETVKANFDSVITKYSAPNQVDLIINEVKVTFFADNENKKPPGKYIPHVGLITVPDPATIAAMKIGAMFDRIKFRDFYDLYAISMAGVTLQEIIESAISFKPYLQSRLINIMLTDGNRITDEKIDHLNPIYKITKAEIENYFKGKVKEWVMAQ